MSLSRVKIAQTVPLFAVADVERLVAFYVDGLGFEMQEKWEKDDELQWCWIQHGDRALMLQKSQGEARANPGVDLRYISFVKMPKRRTESSKNAAFR